MNADDPEMDEPTVANCKDAEIIVRESRATQVALQLISQGCRLAGVGEKLLSGELATNWDVTDRQAVYDILRSSGVVQGRVAVPLTELRKQLLGVVAPILQAIIAAECADHGADLSATGSNKPRRTKKKKSR